MKIIAATAAVIAATSAIASDDIAPVRIRHAGPTVIMHSSTKPIPIQTGDNPIGRPRIFTCESTAGCIVIMTVSLMTDSDALSYAEFTCSYVDGQAGVPCPPIDNEDPNVVHRQMSRVGPGEHTIETKMKALNTVGHIIGWETDYTIYERSPAN
jgi:hypothetical protein